MTSAPTVSPHRRIRVLSSPGASRDSTNQTVQLLVDSLPAQVEVRGFSWVRAFFSGYDVLHIHWPEYLMRHRYARAGFRTRLKQLLFALLMARTAILRTPTVWTVHNVRPHERGSLPERFLLDLWDRRATRRVYMYESAVPSPPGDRNVCIPRGDYEPVYGTIRRRGPSGPSSPGRLLLFGSLRPYKGIESLIDAVRESGDDKLELLVTGHTADESYARHLLLQADETTNVTVRIEVLSDEQLADVILDSAMVVLPYRNMYNSGAALLSLTLRRPILVSDSPTMRDLRREVGDRWVHLFEGELTTEHLRRALRETPAGEPDLSRRDWARVGQCYAALYDSIIETGRDRPGHRAAGGCSAGRPLSRPPALAPPGPRA